MTYRIVTNNTLLHTQHSCTCKVDMVNGDAEDVFTVVEEALQNHWKLLTSPLPPNVPLIRSPIRTLVLQSHSERYDVAGLHCLAKGQERTASLCKPHRPEQRGDLEYIDRTFALRALQELGLPFVDDRQAAAAAQTAQIARTAPMAPMAPMAMTATPPLLSAALATGPQTQEPAPQTALPLTVEIRGVDMQDAQSAVHYLRKKGIYAETAMGKSGLVLRLDAERCAEAKHILYKAGYIYRLSCKAS